VCMRPTDRGYRAYWVDLTAMTLSELPGHILSNATPKACYISGTIYVFRSAEYTSPVQVEKYSVRCKTWTTLKAYTKQKVLFALAGTCKVYVLQRGRALVRVQYFSVATETLSKPVDILDSLLIGQGVYAGLGVNMVIGLRWGYTLWKWQTGDNQVACTEPEKHYQGRLKVWKFRSNHRPNWKLSGRKSQVYQ